MVDVDVSGDESSLPLIIRAAEGNDTARYLKVWVKENRKWIDEKLLQNGESEPQRGEGGEGNNIRTIYMHVRTDRTTGAILFRGFRVTEGADFEDIVKEYEPELSDEYRGVSPRKLIPGTKVRTERTHVKSLSQLNN